MRGITWANIVRRKEQEKKDINADKEKRRNNKENKNNKGNKEVTEEDTEKRERRERQMDRWQEELEERIVKRVEEVVIKYIRNRFVEMEQWVEDKMFENDRCRE